MSEKHPAHRHKALSRREKEEDYFLRKDSELIRKLREKQDAERRALEREQRRQAHWMRCPKCGAALREIEVERVKLDECPECQGIFLDAGELEILMRVKNQGKFWKHLLRKLGS